MLKTFLCLLLVAFSWSATQAALTATNFFNRVLILENSTMPLTTAKATLIVGPLARTNGVYAGDFKVKVFPYFFRSDRGRLAINVPDQVLATMTQGKTVVLSGTSTSAKSGAVRHIEITATPKDGDQGTVNLWFMITDRKMIFNTNYHFASNAVSTACASSAPSNFATNAR